jgi:hypothetical protein
MYQREDGYAKLDERFSDSAGISVLGRKYPAFRTISLSLHVVTIEVFPLPRISAAG